ncbi:unnamed protein product, partial [Onchocerca flexuosa]|uniref:Uncharacterized protein n=1 Tax=Onchocerca flexuosa TaxID=387005 RepID=A0A183HMI5_9BILA
MFKMLMIMHRYRIRYRIRVFSWKIPIHLCNRSVKYEHMIQI